MTITEKIKALLAKAASTTNEHEAEIFLAKAHELMEKHQLDAQDLETDDPVGNERTYRRNGAAAPDWDFMLIFAVAEYFGCKAIRISLSKGYEMDLVGRESARVTAIEMHKYLVKTVRRLGREKAFTMPLINKWGEIDSYLNADQTARRIGNALRSRIRSLIPEKVSEPSTEAGKNALITLDSVTALFDRLHPDAEDIKGAFRTNNAARKIAAGIGLHRQTGSSSGPKFLN